MDYRRPGVWDELAKRLESGFAPQPTGPAGHVNCEPGWSWRFAMPDYDLWLVSAGRGRVVMDGDRFDVEPGTLLFLRPGDRGYGEQEPQDRLTVTYLHLEMARPAASGREVVMVPPSWLPSRQIRLPQPHLVGDPLLRVVRFCEEGDRLSALQARLMLTQAMVEVYRQDAAASGHRPQGIDPRVQAVMRYVRSRPGERPPMEEAAAHVGLSVPHLRRLFARELGVSYRAFLLRSRLERARMLLEGSTMSVGQVARALGYHDTSLLTNQFRAMYGLPPSRVRHQPR